MSGWDVFVLVLSLVALAASVTAIVMVERSRRRRIARRGGYITRPQPPERRKR